MAAITAAAVNELRQATGCGLMDCKKALVENEGDFEKAVVYLREKGLASQAKKATRIAAEGMAYAAVIDGVGVIVEVNCESDFVAGGPLFAEFVSGVAKVIAKEAPADVDALMACPWYTGSGTVDNAKNELFLSVRENMKVRRFERIEGKCVPYVHMKGKVAVLVELGDAKPPPRPSPSSAATSPCRSARSTRSISTRATSPPPTWRRKRRSVSPPRSRIRRTRRSLDAQWSAKIVVGGLGKWFKEICLLQMPFVKDDKVSVEQHVAAVAKELGTPITVKGYVRFEKGEGIEKRQDDLAAEVAKMVNG